MVRACMIRSELADGTPVFCMVAVTGLVLVYSTIVLMYRV